MRVEDVMRRDVLTVRPETPLKDVARVLVENRISGLPVVDTSGKVLGVVSEADFVMRERGRLAEHWSGFGLGHTQANAARSANRKVDAQNAGEAMTSPGIVIAPDRPLREAAGLMIDNRINRLPVVDDATLVGIVTRSDIVRAFIRPDAEIEQAIVSEVIGRAMWLDPTLLTINVSGGVVHIGGTIERRSLVPILVTLVENMEAVVAVETDVIWLEDDTHQRLPTDDLDGVQAPL